VGWKIIKKGKARGILGSPKNKTQDVTKLETVYDRAKLGSASSPRIEEKEKN